MKIYNISLKTTPRYMITAILSLLMLIIISIIAYANNGTTAISYFAWIIQYTINIFHNEYIFPKIFICLFYISMCSIIIWFILAFIQRKIAIKKMAEELYIKDIELLDDIVKFHFSMPICDISYPYNDIENIHMVINTYNKGGYKNSINEITLIFSSYDNSHFTLKCTPDFAIQNFIYKIIDYALKARHFTYNFQGNSYGIEDKIEIYKAKKLKRIISEAEKDKFKMSSLFTLSCSLFMWYVTKMSYIKMNSYSIKMILLSSTITLLAFIFAFLVFQDDKIIGQYPDYKNFITNNSTIETFLFNKITGKRLCYTMLAIIAVFTVIMGFNII